MFNSNTSVNTRVAVLEEKVSIYEQMMSKIESAIHTISETSQNISKMLAIHEEKISSSDRADSRIIERLDKIEETNSKEHKEVLDRLESIEKEFKKNDEQLEKRVEDDNKTRDKKIENLLKFRIFIVAGVLIIGYIVSNPHIIVDILTPDQPSTKVEKTK